MPYTIEDINKILDINKEVEKSKIISLYACVPQNCEVFTGFEQARNVEFKNTSRDYWKSLIEYVLSCNCDFIYLLNSPRPFDIKNPDFSQKIEKLELLLNELKKIGVKKLRIASGQLMSHIAKYYNCFDLLASTSLEYKTILEYENFIKIHSNIKQIVPSHDVNKNFLLLKNLRKKYPNIELEIMVNEGCLRGCPNRNLHSQINFDNNIIINNYESLSPSFATNFCFSILDRYPISSFIFGNNIFPWDIEEYAKIGINNFKLVGRDRFYVFADYVNKYKIYLKGIDNIKNILDCSLADLTHHLSTNLILKKLTVKDCIKYLPAVSHFKKYGHLCASICSYKCFYCYHCIKQLQKVFIKKYKK